LAPKSGERILDLEVRGWRAFDAMDLGCKVVGVDASSAQSKRPVAWASRASRGWKALAFDGEFDAVFSNAALHG
jgi:hypothetical protein